MQSARADKDDLAEFGYKQELDRTLGSGIGGDSHGPNISRKVVMSSLGAAPSLYPALSICILALKAKYQLETRSRQESEIQHLARSPRSA